MRRRSVGASDSGSSVPSSFFFQAEDGIRDYKVTGVQTCALPILEMAIDRNAIGQAERAVQKDLPRGGVEQIVAADDVGDVLLRVIDDDGELIRGRDRKSVV